MIEFEGTPSPPTPTGLAPVAGFPGDAASADGSVWSAWRKVAIDGGDEMAERFGVSPAGAWRREPTVAAETGAVRAAT